jgi:hypothetical protein
MLGLRIDSCTPEGALALHPDFKKTVVFPTFYESIDDTDKNPRQDVTFCAFRFLTSRKAATKSRLIFLRLKAGLNSDPLDPTPLND